MKTPHNPASAASMPASGGVGLGLSIARTLLEAHGATLEATSDGPGRGAKFSARFHLDDSLEAAAQKKRVQP